MTRLALLVLSLAAMSTGSAASAQTCLSVLGCAPKSDGAPAIASPSLAPGGSSISPAGDVSTGLYATSGPLLYDSFGNLRADASPAQADQGLTPTSAPDLAPKPLQIANEGPPAASDPRAPSLQAIPRVPE